jgi:NAD(P)-dependent dehydrogenase (short-subunit alcohol dehydrogenase family)
VDLQLEGKVALVTGASRGIGKAAAEVLAQEGADIAIVARGAEQLQQVAAELRQRTGRRVLAASADTGVDDSVREMVARTTGELGGIDILVNSAAAPSFDIGKLIWSQISGEDIARELNVKVAGYIRCIQAVAPHMIERGWGRIINMAGGAARHVGSTVGSIRNAGVVAMSKNFAAELGPFGINVVAVHPGVVETERSAERIASVASSTGQTEQEAKSAIFEGNHLRRTITALDVAQVVAFLASPKAVGVTGDVISTGGGTERAIFY